jgi:hypothetical protein
MPATNDRMPIEANDADMQLPTIHTRVSPISVNKMHAPHSVSHVRARADAFGVTIDPITVSSDTLPIQDIFREDSSKHVRRTARMPKPRQHDTHDDCSLLYSDSDQEEAQMDTDTADHTLRHYKGKGLAWMKVESDEDPVFNITQKSQKGKPRTDTLRRKSTGRPRGRPKKNKNAWSEKIVHNYDSAYDDTLTGATLWAHLEEGHSGRLRKETPTEPGLTSVLAQERSSMEMQQRAPKRKQKQRPSKKFLSEGIIRNSSEESDADIIVNDTSTNQLNTQKISTETGPHSLETGEQHHDSANGPIITVPGFDSQPTLSPSATNPPTMAYKRVPLPLDEYWDEGSWHHFYNTNTRCLFQTMRSLGLHVGRGVGGFVFTNEDSTKLHNDVNTIAATLAEQLSVDQLIHHAADSNFLNEHIELLFEKHSSIWSQDADRSQLLAPGVEKAYPKNLVYEENKDQRMYVSFLDTSATMVTDLCCRLWMHLHRWIFAKALHGHRRTRGKEYEAMVVTFQLEATSTTVTQVEPTDSLATPPPIASERQQKCTANRRMDHAQPINKQIMKKRKITSVDGADLSALFMTYLELYDNPKFDELNALQNLARETSLLEPYAMILLSGLGRRIATNFFVTCFPTWIAYRREIVEAKRKHASTQSSEQTLHHHVAVMERSRYATRLRRARERFMDTGHDDLRPEVIIYQVFVLLQNSHNVLEIRDKVWTAFKGMEEELTRLGDQLMTGGGAWILGGFDSVSSVPGFLLPQDEISL